MSLVHPEPLNDDRSDGPHPATEAIPRLVMKIRLMHPAVGEIAFPLRAGGSIVVGRLGSATDVEISWDPRISRRHCRLWEKNGRVWFQDLASRNGSWIGHDRVSGVVRLRPGSSVLIGETVLLLPGHSEDEEREEELQETHERPLTEAETASFASTQDSLMTHNANASLNQQLNKQPVFEPSDDPLVLENPNEQPGFKRPDNQPVFEPGPPLSTPPPPTTEQRTLDTPLNQVANDLSIPDQLPALNKTANGHPYSPPPRSAPSRAQTLPPRPNSVSQSRSSPSTRLASSTADLRDSTPSGPVPPPDPIKIVRGSPRFVDSRRVKVRARDRDDLRELWMRDISKGGLFVETRRPPPPDTILEVFLETPAGTIQLRGTVVHVLTEEMAAGFGGQPGVGVQFTDLDPKTRDAIQAYVEGFSDQLRGGSTDLELMSDSESEAHVQKARRFLREAEKNDFYSALEIGPTATTKHIDEVASTLHRELTTAIQRLPPTKKARVEAALNILGRVRRILTHEEGRLEYDFRNGHIRANDRIKAANLGERPSLSALRQAWNRVFPERVDRAALLTRKAFAARQRQDLAAAIDAGRSALELNPFFEELKLTVEVWESAGERHD